MEVLYTYAAALEGDPVADELGLVLRTGIGKTHSAASLASFLTQKAPDLVLLFGLCGVYPGANAPLSVGDLCVVAEDCLADEGVLSDRGFQSLQEMGLGTVGPFAMHTKWSAKLATQLGGLPVVRSATVSTCSGTDAASQAVRDRTGATIENMEGAAAAIVCQQLDVPLVQLRCVSNTTGNRSDAEFDIHGTAAKLQDAVRSVARWGWA